MSVTDKNRLLSALASYDQQHAEAVELLANPPSGQLNASLIKRWIAEVDSARTAIESRLDTMANE